MSSSETQTIETVLGPRPLSELGKTLTHEHLALDFNKFYVSPPEHSTNFVADKIELNNVGYVRQYPYSSTYNLTFNDVESAEAVLKDVEYFHKYNGGTIVENSSHGLKRNISLMKKVSQETGVNIIAGTGYYVAHTQSSSTLNKSEEEMYNEMQKELEIGCNECPEVKAGFIGEVGSTWPIEDFEKRAIRATGSLQADLRCPVSFHPGRDENAPIEIIRLYQEAGGNARKAVMSHTDRTFPNEDDLLEFADETECYCQLDLFGTECSFYQLNPHTSMLSDAQRIEYIRRLKMEKMLKRVLVSHDIHTKHRLTTFGGHGYAHIETNVVPVMLKKGFTKEDIALIMIENPKTWLGQC